MYQDMRGDDGRIAWRRWVFDNPMADDLAEGIYDKLQSGAASSATAGANG